MQSEDKEVWVTMDEEVGSGKAQGDRDEQEEEEEVHVRKRLEQEIEGPQRKGESGGSRGSGLFESGVPPRCTLGTLV